MFPKNFIWGASSAAAQIEGGYLDDGRTPSIWDTMPIEKIDNMEDCHDGCDHYHHYKEDVELMKQIGLKAYRFSISWSRVIPTKNQINPKGIAFYRDLIERLIDAGIQPIITLLHYDMPQWVFDQGGWDNEEVIHDFVFYARTMIETYSDLVSHWLVYNEPQLMLRLHLDLAANSDQDIVYRNMLFAHGKAVAAMREAAKQDLTISTSIMGLSTIAIPGFMEEEEAERISYSDEGGYLSMTRWTDPLFGNMIPDAVSKVISKEDMKVIHQPLDIFAVNLYGAANYYGKKGEKNPIMLPGLPKSFLKKPICPDCMYYLAKFAYRRYHLPILFTENGFCNIDFVMRDGKVHDPQRIDFMHQYIEAVGKAITDGIPVIGYMYWSIIDNFEWYKGCDIRYGLIYVDYQTKKRTLKDSAYDYAEIIKTNGANI